MLRPRDRNNAFEAAVQQHIEILKPEDQAIFQLHRLSAATIAEKSSLAPHLQDPGKDWPSRLLHVPTMTSMVLEMANGHALYGGQADPAYNILTYTWGRWARPVGSAIEVKGVSWKIPPVDPAHFSVDDFLQVIRRISEDTEFIWIDIACIDQENEMLKLDEIGRQAAIFDKAERTFIWLNHCQANELQMWVNEANHSYRVCKEYVPGESLAVDTGEWIKSALETASRLFLDPWFSSLWTLQEAYLRHDATLLSRDGTKVKYPESQFNRPTILHDLIGCYYQIYRTAEQLAREHLDSLDRQQQEDLQDLLRRVEKSGLSPLHDNNPVSIYGVACFRQTASPLDRIYGIMQIFGLNLGGSTHPTLESLEARLGEQLNVRSPVHAQLFVHLQPARHRSCWCLGQHVRVPETARWAVGRYGTTIRDKTPAENFCKILPGSAQGPRFEGFSCTFLALFDLWRKSSLHIYGRSDQVSATHLPLRWVQSVFLDNSPLTERQIPNSIRTLDQETSEQQGALSQALVNSFDNKLRVALLGKLNVQAQGLQTGTVDIWAGMLLLPQEEGSQKFWTRVGICLWELRQDWMMKKIWETSEYLLG